MTCFFFLCAVIIIHVALSLYYNNKATAWHYENLTDAVKGNYAHMEEAEVNELLEATWTPGWQYENWLGFREKARTSRFANVTQAGFRLNAVDQSREEIDGKIWFFGGSTAFGYGVADAETIAARLQVHAKTPTINFGRGYYYSAQENLLLQRLLENGRRPAVVVFLDGLNERCDIQTYQAAMKRFFQRAQYVYSWSPMQMLEPMLFLAQKLSNRLQDRVGGDLHRINCQSEMGETSLKTIVENSLRVRKALCQAFDLTCLTFLQPVAGVHGQHDDFQELSQSRRDKLKTKFDAIRPAFVSAAVTDITRTLNTHDRHAFVDGVHYSAAANDIIARAISDNLKPHQ